MFTAKRNLFVFVAAAVAFVAIATNVMSRRSMALASTTCGSPDSGCPDYAEHTEAMATDGTLGVQVTGSPPAEAGDVTDAAINEVNSNSTANGTGDTLSTTAPGTTTLGTINVTYDDSSGKPSTASLPPKI